MVRAGGRGQSITIECLGEVKADPNFHTDKYIWPVGYKCRSAREKGGRAHRTGAGGRIAGPAAAATSSRHAPRQRTAPLHAGRRLALPAGPAGWPCRLALPAGPAGWPCRLAWRAGIGCYAAASLRAQPRSAGRRTPQCLHAPRAARRHSRFTRAACCRSRFTRAARRRRTQYASTVDPQVKVPSPRRASPRPAPHRTAPHRTAPRLAPHRPQRLPTPRRTLSRPR
jgi:hypothetical protein